MQLPEGVTSHRAKTARLDIHYHEAGDPAGDPIVFVHGNLSSGRFYEHLFGELSDYRIIAPDMRGFGDSEGAAIDGTRGVRDWADDTRALVEHLGVGKAHLVGWSTGGAAVANYAADHPGAVASLTLIDPVSPFGFGGTKDRVGTPTSDDFAGSGGGTAAPEFVERLGGGDQSAESDLSPLKVMRAFYWSPNHTVEPAHEAMLLEEILKSSIGDGGYPGNMTPSPNWPMVAPGTTGILNALSGKYCRWDDIVGIAEKPPILWTHGTADLVVSNNSMFEMGALGAMGAVPGWPGADVFPPQPMVDQIDSVLDDYSAKGGRVRKEMFEGSGHGPIFDATVRWLDTFRSFLASV
ncbi:MAG: alpha/beta hydrolase [Acidimicrobiia bacterium]|nr:alpha/beta hydrolase [Acidimicrobiia bacterium]